MTKTECIEKLDAIIAASAQDNGFRLEARVSDWENYGKSRTYFSIVETRSSSKHYKVKKYGYYDNQSGKYVAEKYGDLNENFTFSGSRF